MFLNIHQSKVVSECSDLIAHCDHWWDFSIRREESQAWLVIKIHIGLHSSNNAIDHSVQGAIGTLKQLYNIIQPLLHDQLLTTVEI